jgi:hypothetical protein
MLVHTAAVGTPSGDGVGGGGGGGGEQKIYCWRPNELDYEIS